MANVTVRNPNLNFLAKRFEEVAVDDGSKSPKQPQRPREEFDEHAAGIGNSSSQDKGPSMVDDGSTDGSTLVLQQNVEKDTGAKKDSVVKEVSALEEDYNSSDYSENYNVGVDDGYLYGYCES
ncbi:hypothetical protein ACLB2K_012625 [Fragaria x ananassa]